VSRKRREERERRRAMLPPVNGPTYLAGLTFLEIEEVVVGAFCPDDEAKLPPIQVHVQIRLKGNPTPLVLRFKGPVSLDRFIAQLEWARGEVWPAAPDSTGTG
jgi:hypothetical protein